MKKLNITILCLSTILLITTNAYGAKKLGQTGFKFLDIGVGARASAMGEAFTMVEGDANCIFYNPAGVAKFGSEGKRLNAVFSRTQWAASLRYNAVGLIYNAGIWGNFGVSLITTGYPESEWTVVDETIEAGYIDMGNVDAGAYAAGLTYARSLTDKFSVGGNVRYAAQHMGQNLLSDSTTVENNVSGLSVDFGTIYHTGFKSLRFGMSVNNFSPEYTYQRYSFQLPLTFKIGMAMDLIDLVEEDHPDRSLVFCIETVHPRDYTQRLHLGLEFTYMNMLAIRVGHKVNYDEESLSAGIGLNVNGIRLDYSYSMLNSWDYGAHRGSLGIGF